jgi:hypothetical protein
MYLSFSRLKNFYLINKSSAALLIRHFDFPRILALHHLHTRQKEILIGIFDDGRGRAHKAGGGGSIFNWQSSITEQARLTSISVFNSSVFRDV